MRFCMKAVEGFKVDSGHSTCATGVRAANSSQCAQPAGSGYFGGPRVEDDNKPTISLALPIPDHLLAMCAPSHMRRSIGRSAVTRRMASCTGSNVARFGWSKACSLACREPAACKNTAVGILRARWQWPMASIQGATNSKKGVPPLLAGLHQQRVGSRSESSRMTCAKDSTVGPRRVGQRDLSGPCFLYLSNQR